MTRTIRNLHHGNPFRVSALASSVAVALAGAWLSGGARAADFMNASDAGGASSFNTALHWASGNAPTTAQTYYVNGWVLRTPSTGTSYTFGTGTTSSPLYLGTCPGCTPAGGTRSYLSLTVTNSVISVPLLQAAGTATVQLANGSATLGSTALTDTVELVDSSTVLSLNAVSYTLTVNSRITGAGGVSYESSGANRAITVLRNAGNDYTGNTTVSGALNRTAVLRMGVENALPNALKAGAANSGDVILTGSTAAGSGGTLRLAGFNTTINGLSANGTAANAIVDNVGGAAATLTILGDVTSGGTNNTFGGTIINGVGGGALSVTKSGTGNASAMTRQFLTGANTYTGATTVNDGYLRVNGTALNASTNGALIIGSNGAAAGTLELNDLNSNPVTRNNAVTLTGRGLDQAHIDNVAGSSTLSGVVTLAAGGKFNLASTASGGSLNLTGAIDATALTTGTHEINLSGVGNGSIAQGIALSAAATNALNKTGTGTWTLGGAVTDLDTLSVTGGTLELGAGGTTVAGTAAVATNLRLKGVSVALGGLTGGGTVSDTGTGNSLITLGASDGVARDFAGTLTDINTAGSRLSLYKTGTNRQTLSGTTTYTGTTTIEDGQLRFSGANSLSNLGEKITVTGSNSGTLELLNTGVSGDAVDLVGRQSSTYHIDNIAGDNTLNGVITLSESADHTGGARDDYNIHVTADSLTLTNGVQIGTNTDSHPINLNLSADSGATGHIGAVDFTGAAAGVNDIVKTGAGTWSLDGATTELDDVKVQGGTLVFNNTAINYSGSATIDAGATLKQGVAGAVSNRNVAVNGVLDLNGFDTTLQGLNGTGAGASVTTGAAGNPGPGVLLTLTAGGSYAGGINDGADLLSLTLNADASDRQILAGAGTYTGKTTISGGILEIRNGGALGAPAGLGTDVTGQGTLALAGGISSPEALTLFGRTTSQAHIDNVSEDNALTAPTITLAAGGAFDNYNLTVTAGTLTIGSDIDGSATGNAAALNLDAAGGSEGILDGDITLKSGGSTALNKTGLGTWTINGSATNVTSVDVDAGTLSLGTSLSVGGDINVDGTLDLAGGGATGYGLTGGGTVTGSGSAPLRLGHDGSADKTFTGIIGGSVDLTKTGNNVQVLGGTGVNTYTGLTTIEGGTLAITKNSALGAATGAADGTIIGVDGKLALTGGIDTPEYLSLQGRGSATAAVTSSGDNRLSGLVTLTAGTAPTDRYYDLESTAGTLTVGAGIVAAAGTTNVSLALLGPGNTHVLGGIDERLASGEHKVYALGTGNKTIEGVVNLANASVDGARIGNEGGGNLTLQGDAILADSLGDAGLRNYGTGTLTAGNVDLSGATGKAYVYNRDSGAVTVTGALDMSGSATAEVLNQGAGTLTLSGTLTGNGINTKVESVGAGGRLVVDGTLTGVRTAGATAGTFVVGAGANLDGVSRFEVGAGAVIDATAVASNFNIKSGQTLFGAGTVKGDVVAQGGSTIDIGNGLGTNVATLTFDGNLSLSDYTNITFNIGSIDVLNVTGELSITELVNLRFVGTATANFYVFANYGTLFGTFEDIDAPTGYSFDYAYNGNHIALVRNSPIPLPAPLFLIGLGAFVLGVGRRYARW